MEFVYVVGHDQEFGGLEVSRDWMIVAFGLESVIDWEIEAVLRGDRGYMPSESIGILSVSKTPAFAHAVTF